MKLRIQILCKLQLNISECKLNRQFIDINFSISIHQKGLLPPTYVTVKASPF